MTLVALYRFMSWRINVGWKQTCTRDPRADFGGSVIPISDQLTLDILGVLERFTLDIIVFWKLGGSFFSDHHERGWSGNPAECLEQVCRESMRK